MKRIGIVALAVASLLAVLVGTGTEAHASERADRTYRVTVTNTTDGQYFTPANFAAHGRDRIFGYGRTASEGIQAVAENGAVPVLDAEFAAAGYDNAVIGDAPIQHGQSATFEVTTNERRFSLVTMLICTNDGFGGVNSRRLPARMGEVTNDVIRSYDAGTEINTERNADIVPAPFCAGDGEGTGETNPDLAENGRIRGHRGIQGNGDLGDNFDFGRFVGNVTIERIG